VGFAFSSGGGAVLQRLEFVALGGPRVLVVVVSQGNRIAQKVVDAGEEVSPDDLARAANYLNAEFAGLPLPDVREAVLARLEEERTLYDHLMGRALRLASSMFADMPRQAFHVEGAASLLGTPVHEGVSLATLRALFEMMDEKERLLRLLNQYIDGPGLTVVIGNEHANPDLRSFSLIASTAVDNASTRTVGVIGPTRMHYSRAIALVDAAAQAVSRVLRDAH
jgi:heat-inducible transcriptional repressor